eukprot:scaffold7198_cov150-Skeletonema_menzelii.AAC.4
MTATQTRRRRAAVQKLMALASIIVVKAAHRPLPTASSMSRFRAHKALAAIHLRGGAIDDGRRPPSRYSSNYDDVSRYGREGRDNSRRFDEYDDRQPRNGRSYQNFDDRNLDSNDDKKGKGWFGRSKEEVNQSDYEQQSNQGEDLWNNSGAGLPPPPPPPPPPQSDASLNIDIHPAETERTPIHYKFPTAEVAADERRAKDTAMEAEMDKRNDDPRGDAPDIPFIEEDELSDRDRSSRRRRRRSDDDDDVYLSPRRDAVTTFMSTKKGAFKVRLGSIIVGAALGGFMGKVSPVTARFKFICVQDLQSKLASHNQQSLLNDPVIMAITMATLLFVAGFLRNDYGELSRALGLALVFTLQRTKSVRKDNPTLVHIKALIGQGPRKPFPPVDEESSPWRYEPIYEDDPDFKMTYVLLAMALVGSFCGGNVPLLPQWMGGIIGAVAFASFTQGSNAQGDLGRTMGMRIVGLVQVVTSINSELRILGKAATVGGLIFDKMMILDRKHRVKDKFVAICKFAYDKVARTADLVQEDIKEDRRDDRRDRPASKSFDDDDDERRGRPARPRRDFANDDRRGGPRRDFDDDRRGRPNGRDRDREDGRREPPSYRRR